MEQFSGGGPPNPRFLPKLSMTLQVNHKKLYYNYYTLGKYLLKIQILRQKNKYVIYRLGRSGQKNILSRSQKRKT